MSIFASIIRSAYKISGAKKAFCLPEDELKRIIEKQNRSRGVFTPTDHKAHYETITVNGWTVRKSAVLKASFPLTYAECVKLEV